jgi:hypothetical protein
MERKGIMTDAIIGRYEVRMEKTGMVLTHPAGISFDLTVSEALRLHEFIGMYRKTLQMVERDTEPEMKRVVIKEPQQEL